MSQLSTLSAGHLTTTRSATTTARLTGLIVTLVLAFGATAAVGGADGSDHAGKKYGPSRSCVDCRG